MKKIDLVTGFLGSGKTTFLKQYVKYLISTGEKVCVLENDFGAVNVDMMFLNELRGENCELEMVAGGCDMDCHRRRFKTKLIAMGMDDYTRIVVEPSGVFDVDEFFDALFDEPLCNWYEIGSVIGVVDALMDEGISDKARFVLASEMACAGKIILSKTQLADKTKINNTKALVQDCITSVGSNRNVEDDFLDKDWSDFTEDDFEQIKNASYRKESFIKKVQNYDSFSSVYFLDPKLDVESIKRIAEKLFNDKTFGNVIRLKGFIFTDNTWQEVNIEKNSIDIKCSEVGQDVIIIIGENLDEGEIKKEVEKYVKEIS